MHTKTLYVFPFPPVTTCSSHAISLELNPLNAELNYICHLLALLGAHHILHVSKIRVNIDEYYRS
jgi:hypothetical protein